MKMDEEELPIEGSFFSVMTSWVSNFGMTPPTIVDILYGHTYNKA
jgi:hypothetical protein